MSGDTCCNETPCQWGDHPCERKNPPRWAAQYDFDKSDPATRLFVAASNWMDRADQAERELVKVRAQLLAAQQCFENEKATSTHLETLNAALVRQAIFQVLDDGQDGLDWDFNDDEERVDFADAVVEWIVRPSALSSMTKPVAWQRSDGLGFISDESKRKYPERSRDYTIPLISDAEIAAVGAAVPAGRDYSIRRDRAIAEAAAAKATLSETRLIRESEEPSISAAPSAIEPPQWQPWAKNPPEVQEPAVYAVLVDCGDGSLEAMKNLTMVLAEWSPQLTHGPGSSNWPGHIRCMWSVRHINYWFPVELGASLKNLEPLVSVAKEAT